MTRSLRFRVWVIAFGSLLLLGADRSCHWSSGDETVVLALTAESSLAEGCFAPLRCPVALAEEIGGTFRLELVAAGDLLDLYDIRDVYWLARLYGEDVPITGWGSYVDGVSEDRMHLVLRFGDGELRQFDSGPMPGGAKGVDSIEATVSIHGQSHFDTVIDVRAVAFPVPSRTPCGPAGLECDRETEVCVARTPIGPAIVYGCEPVPEGCEEDRGCGCAGLALCRDAFGVCTELGDNTLQCECPQCQ